MYKNHGVIKDPRSAAEVARDFMAGASPVPQVALQEDGQWDNFLPVYESQLIEQSIDTLGCVTFSQLNCFEILFKRLFGVEVNFSDRSIAKLSNTDKNNGNWPMNVLNTIRKYGLTAEREWPLEPNMTTKKQYYADVPQAVIDKSKKFLELYIPNGEFIWPVTKDNLIANLRYSPIQVIAYNSSHAITCFGENKDTGKAKMFDHYQNFGTNVYDYDWSGISYAMKFSLARIIANFVKTKTSSTIYLKVDGDLPVLAPIKNSGTYWELSNRKQTDGWAYSMITEEELKKYKIIKPISVY